jgi:signal transduction histidine kinase/ActR/RegA family two-component response regulator
MDETVNSSRPHLHVVQFYEGDGHMSDTVALFLREGLDRGEAAMVVAGEKNRHSIVDALERSGCDVQTARRQGKLWELDAEGTLAEFMQGGLRRGMPDEILFRRVIGRAIDRATSGNHGVRIYGEMVDILTEHGNEVATARLEELWNELAETRSFQLHCGYSLSNFRSSEDTDAFERICALHSDVIPAEPFDSNGQSSRHVANLQQRAGALETEIHERKSLERALREEQERLREANRRKDEFIALLSHELRNPLAPILTSLDVMDVRGDETSRREREIIRRQARHLAALVEDLLDVSRVASGKITLQKQATELAPMAMAALEMASPLIQERRHKLDVNIPKTGLMLEADPVRLPQVLSNLLTNAARYTPAEGRIVFSAERCQQEIIVTVEDNGIGIPHEAMGNIFAPFIQGRRSLDRAEGGLGLGLTLVRSLTQLHGGSVSVHSDGPGKGSRFTLHLPALSAARVRDPHPAPQLVRNGEPAHHGDHRVMVVDDNEDATAALAELIGFLGYEVRTAPDGPTAIEIARGFHPAIAFVDIGLPGMDGYALATWLRRMQNGSPLRLIAVSGYGQDTDRAKGTLAGFDAHAVKPLELVALRKLLEHHHDAGDPRSAS